MERLWRLAWGLQVEVFWSPLVVPWSRSGILWQGVVSLLPSPLITRLSLVYVCLAQGSIWLQVHWIDKRISLIWPPSALHTLFNTLPLLCRSPSQTTTAWWWLAYWTAWCSGRPGRRRRWRTG